MLGHNNRLIILILLILFKTNSLVSGTSPLIDYLNKAEKFMYINNDSSFIYYEKALQIANSNNLISKEIEILFLLTKIEITRGNPLRAIHYCNLTLSISESYGFEQEYLSALIHKGNIYQVAGLMSEALEILFEAESRIDKSKIQNSDNHLDLNLFLASTYYDMNEIPKSTEYLIKNLALKKINPYNVKLAGTYILLANIHNDPDSIFYYLNKAEIIVKENTHSTNELLVILNNKALVNKALGFLKKSKSIYIKAINIALEHGYKPYLANLYNNYAYQLMAENNLDSVEYVLNEAFTISRQIQDIDLEASILDTYSDYYKTTNDLLKALDFKNRSIIKRNEYREKQQINQSLFLSTVFETEKKELEIEKQKGRVSRFQAILFGSAALIIFLVAILMYYRQKSAIRKARLIAAGHEKSIEVADALIEGQDSERKKLAADLHDGLGARIGTLRFKLDDILSDNSQNEEIAVDINNIAQHIRELSHQMLPAQLEDNGLIYSLQQLFNSISKTGSISVYLDNNLDTRLPIKLETHLYYLIYEMVNNAIKHSGCSEIYVQLINHDASLNLSVEDNGKGLPQHSTSDGLGLRNINHRILYLGGSIQIESEENAGTIFMIEIPIYANN